MNTLLTERPAAGLLTGLSPAEPYGEVWPRPFPRVLAALILQNTLLAETARGLGGPLGEQLATAARRLAQDLVAYKPNPADEDRPVPPFPGPIEIGLELVRLAAAMPHPAHRAAGLDAGIALLQRARG